MRVQSDAAGPNPPDLSRAAGHICMEINTMRSLLLLVAHETGICRFAFVVRQTQGRTAKQSSTARPVWVDDRSLVIQRNK